MASLCFWPELILARIPIFFDDYEAASIKALLEMLGHDACAEIVGPSLCSFAEEFEP